MMDDLVLHCCRRPEDFVEIQDEEFGVTSIAIAGDIEAAGVVLSKEDAIKLRDWLIDYLKPFDPIAVQLDQAQAALRHLMELLPHLVRLADRVGVDLSEQPWIDRAQTYIDIYEGRTP